MTRRRSRSKKNPLYLEDITDVLPFEGSRIEANDFFSANLFMGLYDETQIMKKLEKVGIIQILQQKGFRKLLISIDKQDAYTSRLYVNFDTIAENTRLIEVIVREGFFKPKQSFIPAYDFTGGLPMLLIEWLTLQDPTAGFTSNRPRLPGQDYPGLGGLKSMQEFLYKMGKASGKAAIIDIPEHFHTAVIYSSLYSRIYSATYSFFSPVDAGIMQAMKRDLNERSLAETSFAVAFDCLINSNTGDPARWISSEQVYPISEKLKSYVEDDRYKEIALATMNDSAFSINWEKFDRLKEKGLLNDL
ncbi:MAG: hypothetical protein CVU52_00260 [Deltaproteobacteria bacterium HGW-Deltaproteobacteria-10]|nr:MAG: hypothetical protein CVU52_00260 [Deltaproteobacteria bacterium HGW-Deltaproteobacteria-10]